MDLAKAVGIYDPLWREREELRRRQQRADRALWLAWGAICGTLMFLMVVAVHA